MSWIAEKQIVLRFTEQNVLAIVTSKKNYWKLVSVITPEDKNTRFPIP